MKDDKGLRIAAQGTMLIIPTAYTFTAQETFGNSVKNWELQIMTSMH